MMSQLQASTYDSFGLDFTVQWEWNLDRGVMVFSRHGEPIVETKLICVGTTAGDPKTWRWAWANDSFGSNITGRLSEVREYGERETFHRLTDPEWLVSGNDPHDVTLVSAAILGCPAFFHHHDEHDRGIFFLLEDFRRLPVV